MCEVDFESELRSLLLIAATRLVYVLSGLNFVWITSVRMLIDARGWASSTFWARSWVNIVNVLEFSLLLTSVCT